jgi:hypothetical protein
VGADLFWLCSLPGETYQLQKGAPVRFSSLSTSPAPHRPSHTRISPAPCSWHGMATQSKLEREEGARQALVRELEDLRTAFDAETDRRRQLEVELRAVASVREQRLQELRMMQGGLG